MSEPERPRAEEKTVSRLFAASSAFCVAVHSGKTPASVVVGSQIFQAERRTLIQAIKKVVGGPHDYRSHGKSDLNEAEETRRYA